MAKDKSISNTPADKPVSSKWSNSAFVLGVLLLIATIPLKQFASDLDNAIGNVVIAIGVTSALACFYFGTIFRRRLTPSTRLVVAMMPALLVGIFAGIFRFEGLSGELVPQFRPRWIPTSISISEGIAAQDDSKVANGRVSLSLPNSPNSQSEFLKYSSTQFFGDRRNGQHPEIQLATDWNENAPKTLWKLPIGKGWASFAVRDGYAVTLEQSPNGTHEHLVALNLESGLPIWKVALEGTHFRIEGGAGPRSTPLIAGDDVFALTSAGKVASVELKTGNLNWQKDLLTETHVDQTAFETEVKWGRSGSPLLVDDKIVIPAGGNAAQGRTTLIAFDKSTGETIWKAGNRQINYSSPMLMTIDGVDQIVNADEKMVAGYSIEDGYQLWQFEWPSHSDGDASVSQPVQIDSNALFVSKGYFQGCSLVEIRKSSNGWQVEPKWASSKSLKTKFTSCVHRDGYVYGLNDGKLECVDVRTGERQWIKGRYGHGQILMCNDLLLISSEGGELLLVTADPKEPKELCKMQVLDGVTWNIPTLAGNCVLMRNSTQAACLQLPTSAP